MTTHIACFIYMYFYFTGAKQYAKDIGAIFTETSALTAINIQQLFEDIGNCTCCFFCLLT